MPRRTAMLTVVILAMTASTVVAAPLAVQPPPAPPGVTTVPAGPRTRCTTSGPAWVAYGIHTPNAPPRRGNRYLVDAWGLTCPKASALLRAMAPRIPANRDTRFPGPAGFTCTSRRDGAVKNRLYSVSCIRRNPAAMFSWQAN